MSRIRRSHLWMAALIVSVILLISPVPPPFPQLSSLFFGTAGAEEKASPAGSARGSRLGLVETTGVTLTLLDVEVADKEGKPLRGLGKEDFHVSLNGKDWPLYSVDDLCSCEPSPSGGEAKRNGGESSSGGAPMRVAGPPAERATEPPAPGSPGSESPAPPSREAARAEEAAGDLP